MRRIHHSCGYTRFHIFNSNDTRVFCTTAAAA
uniref:Uncharacterized protein n=1 Tax=Rhizophora mucronata TaxID=61149 RepID=A0A2P2P5U1_RHIMU